MLMRKKSWDVSLHCVHLQLSFVKCLITFRKGVVDRFPILRMSVCLYVSLCVGRSIGLFTLSSWFSICISICLSVCLLLLYVWPAMILRITVYMQR